jgi:hypothetical protein
MLVKLRMPFAGILGTTIVLTAPQVMANAPTEGKRVKSFILELKARLGGFSRVGMSSVELQFEVGR